MTTKLMPFLMSVVLFVSPALLFSSQPNPGEKVSTTEFFEKIQGRYQIILVGTQVPKEDNKIGHVLLENGELTMVFPYCHKDSGVCDPGFRTFLNDNTEVYQKTLEPQDTIFTLIKKEAEKTYYYTWQVRNNIIHFADPQYTLASGEAFPLEFILERAPEPPPVPAEP